MRCGRPYSRWLTPHKAAHRLDVCTKTIYRWIRTGHLPAYRLPTGRLRIPEDAIDGIAAPAGSAQMRTNEDIRAQAIL